MEQLWAVEIRHEKKAGISGDVRFVSHHRVNCEQAIRDVVNVGIRLCDGLHENDVGCEVRIIEVRGRNQLWLPAGRRFCLDFWYFEGVINECGNDCFRDDYPTLRKWRDRGKVYDLN